METEDNREDSIIKVKIVSERDSNQGALEQEDSDLRQVKTVSEQEDLGQQDKAITIVSEQEASDQDRKSVV